MLMSYLPPEDIFLNQRLLNNKWGQHAIDDIYQSIHGPEGYRKVDGENQYVHSQLYPWAKEIHAVIFTFITTHKCGQKRLINLMKHWWGDKQELESDNLDILNQEAYSTFFIVKTSPKRGKKVSYNMDAVSQYINRYAGFQALFSNGIKDPIEAILFTETKT